MLAEATIVDISHVPSLAEVVTRVTSERERTDPFVLSGLLSLLPSQCGSDGRLYRRRRTAEQAAEAYADAVMVLRPRARLYWHMVPDGNGWRWWAVLLPDVSER
jgi:hypothetical protein